MITFTHEQYLSPFTWRYGSDEMRAIWSEKRKRYLWRRLWIELARAQQAAGLVTTAQVAELEAHVNDIDMTTALEIESRIHHDLMAEVQTYAAQCPTAGGIIHLGATSADIEDNADVIRLRHSLELLLIKLGDLLSLFADHIDAHAGRVVMAFTHLQPAEPTTLGYRFAVYAQDLLEDSASLGALYATIRGKGFKGAVGTAAAYTDLLSGTPMTAAELEQRVMSRFKLSAYSITGQTYPRKLDWQMLSALSGMAGSLYKFAFDLRVLQSPMIGEVSEPFGRNQVGSSAMPFKRNPINAEKIDSLGRLIAALTQTAWDNASHSLLERTLDDSANRREILPTAFLAADEMLTVTHRIVKDLRFDENAMERNLARYGIFAATERVLMAAVKAGGDRQHLHEVIRTHSLNAWAAVAVDQPNPLADLIASDADILKVLTAEQVRTLLNAADYVGDAPMRARAFAAKIRDDMGI